MILNIFSVYDSAAESYLQPFFMQTKGQAIRAFTDAVNDNNNVFCKYPDDYTLFELGSYDDSKGSFVMLSAPRSIGNALEFKKVSNVPANVA